MSSSMLIKHARLVNEGHINEVDVRIEAGRIAAIAGSLAAKDGDTVVDADGDVLMPGMIDAQVHFREPGFPHKGDLATESLAAVCGGVTSFFDMPNTNPPTLTAEALEDKYTRAAGRAHGNYAFYFGASNDNLEHVKALDPKASPGVKIFMGASTGNMLVDDVETLNQMFAHAPTPIITHCEDTPMINAALEKAINTYGDRIPAEAHIEIRSREACLKSSKLAVELAKRHGTSLHVLHISTADELALFVAGDLRDKQITAETCVHFLSFDRSDYAQRGMLIKCNPAIKEASDRKALIEALNDDRIDVLATDHAPHTWDEKDNPYRQAPSGLPLVQDALPAALELVHEGLIPLEKVVEKYAHAPAIRFDVAERGFVREGYFADLTLVRMDDPYTVQHEFARSKCGWTPFFGRTFRSKVRKTWVNGTLVFDEGNVVAEAQGQRITFQR